MSTRQNQTRGDGELCSENRTKNSGRFPVSFSPYNPENSRIATPEPAGPAEKIEDVKENLAF